MAPKAFPTNKKTGKSTFEEEFEFTEKGLVEESEWTDGLEKFVKRPTKTTLEDKIAEIRRERKRVTRIISIFFIQIRFKRKYS